MRIIDGMTYKLVEADMSIIEEDGHVCDQCALVELCDKVAEEMNDIDYVICEEDEDMLQEMNNPIYKLMNNE